MRQQRFWMIAVVLGASALLWPGASSALVVAPRMPGPGIPLPQPIPPWPGDGWVWIAPTYRTVYERVYQEGHYQLTHERIWVPEQCGWRTICVWESGQWVERKEWVVITPGYWSNQPRQIWVPGGWTMRARTIEVSPGRWEWRGPGIEPGPMPLPTPRPDPTTRPPELKPFSPLWEWPDKK